MKELLISLTFIITFSSCAERNVIPEDIIDDLPGSYEKVPFRYYSGRVLFDVTISDSIKASLLFDTGGDNFYLDSLFFANSSLRFKNIATARIGGNGEGLQRADIIMDTAEFILGSKSYSDSRVPVINVKPITGRFVDGIIGTEFFRDRAIGFNFIEEYAAIYDSLNYSDFEGYIKLDFDFVNNRILVPARVFVNELATIDGSFMIDMGGSGTVSIIRKIAEDNKLSEIIKDKVQVDILNGGLGGRSSRYSFVCDSIGFAGFTIDAVPMYYSVDNTGSLSDRNYTGMIYNDILDRFNLIIDFKGEALYLKPNRTFEEKYYPRRLGFKWVDRTDITDGWVVNSIYIGSGADIAGLKQGDVILKINGTLVGEVSLEKMKSIERTENSINIKVDRSGQILEFSFRLL